LGSAGGKIEFGPCRKFQFLKDSKKRSRTPELGLKFSKASSKGYDVHLTWPSET